MKLKLAKNTCLKGMGGETLIGLLHIMPQKHPLLIKRTGTTLLDQAHRPFLLSLN